MFRKLQIKFIALTMTIAFTVLMTIVICINVVNYTAMVEELDETLNFLTNDKGMIKKEPKDMEKHLPKGMSPEKPYKTRYFYVTVSNEDNTIAEVEISKIASVDRDEAQQLALKTLNRRKINGFSGNYRYIVTDDGEYTRIIFLECSGELEYIGIFIVSSIGISLGGSIVVFLLVIFFSNKIMKPVSDSYEKQKRFITDAGHELKTPLTIINADADVLEMDMGENEWIDDIKKQTERLTDLTNNLIILSRMDEQAKEQKVSVPISDVITEVITEFQAPAYKKDINYKSEIQQGLYSVGSVRSIRQLISILLDNAVKYCPEKGKIAVSFQQQGRLLIFKVSNTVSEPITQKNLENIFDRFYRIDASRNSETGGFGIGLSAAKAITEAYNGKISAGMSDKDSILFTVQLPN